MRSNWRANFKPRLSRAWPDGLPRPFLFAGFRLLIATIQGYLFKNWCAGALFSGFQPSGSREGSWLVLAVSRLLALAYCISLFTLNPPPST